jgi:hypothetical protein
MLPDSFVAFRLTRERVQEIFRQAERDKVARMVGEQAQNVPPSSETETSQDGRVVPAEPTA